MDTIQSADKFLTLIPSDIATLPQVPLEENHLVIYGLIYIISWLILIIIIKNSNEKLLTSLLTAIFSFKKTVSLFGSVKNSLGIYTVLCLMSFSTLSIGLSFMTGNIFLPIHTVTVLAALLLFHFFTISVIKLIGWTFKNKNTANQITSEIWLANISAGLYLFPFVATFFFVPEQYCPTIVTMCAAIISICLLLKYFVCIKTLIYNSVFISYIILYLCTFEIIPLILVIKSVDW